MGSGIWIRYSYGQKPSYALFAFHPDPRPDYLAIMLEENHQIYIVH
jgi:hypothetical protein